MPEPTVPEDALVTDVVCRCGVYRHLHPTDHCTKLRLSWWWHRHDPLRHLRVRLWWLLPDKARWKLTGVYERRHPNRCWCDMFDAYYDAKKERRKYHRRPHGCLCDAPLLAHAATLPRPGGCYCPPWRGQP